MTGTRDAALPLLRSPPFPGVPPSVAAVSEPIDPPAAPTLSSPALLAHIREARIGGSFWAPAARDPRPVVLRARDAETLEAVHNRARADGHPDSEMIAVVPAAFSLFPAVVQAIEPVDPWSLLAPKVRLYAEPGDEWVLLAELAGADVVGAFPPGMLATALAAARYRDPFAGTSATPERAIAILAEWRRMLDANRRVAVATGMSWWKRDAVGRMLWSGAAPLPFVDEAVTAVARAQTSGGAIATWPSRAPEGLAARAVTAAVPLIQVEDGFIRSAGLGANLLPPQSIVADARGIYYDPTGPSDLEHLLEHADMPPALLERAAALRRFVVARGISKYSAGGAALPPLARDGRRLVLVTGQVEDDLSVRRAGAGIRTNAELLVRARAAEPDARLLFKPHPDVDAGHRIGRIPEQEALKLADEVVRAPIDALLAQVDAVHVLTSLTGFEALLRGLPVTVHGQPFYAGWSLTTDIAPPLARRTRRRTLDELVAATLLLYPRYLDPVTGLPCPPEILLERMAAGTMPKPSLLVRARALQGRVARLLGTATTRNRDD